MPRFEGSLYTLGAKWERFEVWGEYDAWVPAVPGPRVAHYSWHIWDAVGFADRFPIGTGAIVEFRGGQFTRAIITGDGWERSPVGVYLVFESMGAPFPRLIVDPVDGPMDADSPLSAHTKLARIAELVGGFDYRRAGIELDLAEEQGLDTTTARALARAMEAVRVTVSRPSEGPLRGISADLVVVDEKLPGDA